MAVIRHPGKLSVDTSTYSDVRPISIQVGLISAGMQLDEAGTFAIALIDRIAAINHETAVSVLSKAADSITNNQ